MFKDAVIDIGSNSVRLLMPSNRELARKNVITTRLALGLKSGMLAESSIARTADAVEELVLAAKSYNPENIFIFATEAVRRAKNSDILTDRIFKSTGLNVEIIDGDTEAMLGYLGASLSFNDARFVLDIGGASSELVQAKSGKIIYQKSLSIGAGTLTEKYGKTAQNFEENYRLMYDYAFIYAKEFSVCSADELCDISGTFSTLASIFLNLNSFSDEAVHGFTFSRKDLDLLVKNLLPLSLDKICEKFPTLQFNRAAVLKAGCAILAAIMDLTGAQKIKVCCTDNLEGYLVYKNRTFNPVM